MNLPTVLTRIKDLLCDDDEVIKKYNDHYVICNDCTPIDILLGNLRSKNHKLSIDKLKFKAAPLRGIMPNCEGSLDIILTINYKEDDSIIPIKKSSNDKRYVGNNYQFSIEIFGKEKGKEKYIKARWHLDYDNGSDSEYTHPAFHFTFGGHEDQMIEDLHKEDNENVLETGDILIITAPRIQFPPLDIVLGIDFILSNFFRKEIYQKFLSNSIYKSAVKEAQETYWKPYYLSIGSSWDNSIDSQYSSIRNELIPSLMSN